jgi:hypothetical protein
MVVAVARTEHERVSARSALGLCCGQSAVLPAGVYRRSPRRKYAEPHGIKSPHAMGLALSGSVFSMRVSDASEEHSNSPTSAGDVTAISRSSKHDRWESKDGAISGQAKLTS